MSEEEKRKPRKPRKPNFSVPIDLSVLEKAPPHDYDAERAVLGALLRDPELCDDVVMVLRDPDDFHHDAHKRIFSHMMKMRSDNSSIDLLLLVNNLRTTEELELVGGQFYLGELMSSVPVSVHAIHYAKIVKDKATLRKLIHTGSSIVQDAYAPETQVKALLNRAASQMTMLCEAQTTNQVTDMGALMDSLVEWIALKDKGLVDGIKTGYVDLDNLIEGFHQDELIILAARTGMGKTALALNIVENIAIAAKQTVLFVSLEMGSLELAKRLICSRARLDSHKLRKGFLGKEEYNRFTDVASELGVTPLFIDDTPGRSISEIAAVARRLKRHNDLKLVVIDYIGLITPENPEEPRQEQVAKIARRLKLLARELHIPVLCLAQLNRGADSGRQDEYPRLSQLRESGAIEQDADVVMFIHRKDKGMSREDAIEKGVHNRAVLVVAKQRSGATDDIPLLWRGEWTRFFSADEHHEQMYEEDFGGHVVQEGENF
jgi:replicative DNA helicase